MNLQMILKRMIDALLVFVWLINGLFCKVLNLVPRHERIVSEILGSSNAPLITRIIGLAEMMMAFWVVTGYKSRLNAIIQILVIAIMNILEAILVPHLLLFGRFNAVFAGVLITIIYFRYFQLFKPSITGDWHV